MVLAKLWRPSRLCEVRTSKRRGRSRCDERTTTSDEKKHRRRRHRRSSSSSNSIQQQQQHQKIVICTTVTKFCDGRIYSLHLPCLVIVTTIGIFNKAGWYCNTSLCYGAGKVNYWKIVYDISLVVCLGFVRLFQAYFRCFSFCLRYTWLVSSFDVLHRQFV